MGAESVSLTRDLGSDPRTFWVSAGEARSTLERRSSLHLFRLGEAMLRIIRDKNRPLLHTVRAWSVVAPHLVEVRPPHLYGLPGRE